MTDAEADPEREVHRQLEQDVATRAARKLQARKEKDRSIWFGLGMFGLIGWSVTVPTLMGAALGIWIDRQWPGDYSWTLMLMLLGVGLGCLNAWNWVQRESHDNEQTRHNGT